MHRKVLVPGTFDPMTLGHIDIVERSSKLFDEVVVGVAASQNKGSGPLFSLDERVDLASAATEHLANVTVEPFSIMLVDFAASIGADAIVKGLRVTTDFEDEFQMAALNYRLKPELETLFIMSDPEHMYVSSSIAKEIASFGGPLTGLVPTAVEQALRKKYPAATA
ncbi:MAG: pantetheine-phosphate adenylyltransferase [Coriobacteriaceae bacterium]|nr:pantetheine-phosphate adenylyltransferase [Coriobacteriaceae bacterium]